MPAILKVSLRGGIDFIIPDRKLAVVDDPFSPFMLSQTVILSIFRFLTASTWIRVSSSILSVSKSCTAESAFPPAAWTIAAKPSACLDRIS